jgi:hypothetical protein
VYICLCFAIPYSGYCNAAQNLLSYAERSQTENVQQEIEELQDSILSSKDPVLESRKFLQSFIDEINIQYGMQLTMADACRLLRENLHLLQMPKESEGDFLAAIELFESEPPVTKWQSTQLEAHIYPPWEWSFFGLNKKHSSKHKHPSMVASISHEPHLELPNRMAIGVALAAGGVLACLVPGGQGLGVWMITTGAVCTLEGLATGEKPFYRNSDTGEITPFSPPLPK